MEVEDGAHHQYVHDLVAVAPVVEEARAKALGDAGDVDDPAQHGQRVHGEEVAQRGGAPPAQAHPAQQEEGEAEEGLPGEGAQPADAAAGRHGAVDGVAGQQDVDQQRHGADERVAEQRGVDDGQRSCWKTHTHTHGSEREAKTTEDARRLPAGFALMERVCFSVLESLFITALALFFFFLTDFSVFSRGDEHTHDLFLSQ